MAETEPGTPPDRVRIGNTGERGRRQPAMHLGHHPRDDEFPVDHLTPHLDLGSPSTRSATMFRRISEVPASIVLPRLRSWWYVHGPFSICDSGPRISSAS